MEARFRVSGPLVRRHRAIPVSIRSVGPGNGVGIASLSPRVLRRDEDPFECAGGWLPSGFAMDRKTWGIVVLVIAAIAVPMYRLTDWFSHKAIQVSVSFRPLRQPEPGAALPVVVGLDQDYELSSLVVSEVPPEKTNAAGRVVWRLEKQGKGVATRGFLYGQPPEGLQPAAKAGPEPLKAGASYLVEVAAGKVHGSTIFQARGSDE